MERRLSASLRATAIGVAATYVLYLLVGNALLNSGYGQSIANRMPEKLVASWGSAWTLYPGHVHARDVRLAGHVRHTVWSVQADSVRGRIALFPLLAREVRVPALVATDVSGGATRIDVERVPPSRRRAAGRCGSTMSSPRPYRMRILTVWCLRVGDTPGAAS